MLKLRYNKLLLFDYLYVSIVTVILSNITIENMRDDRFDFIIMNLYSDVLYSNQIPNKVEYLHKYTKNNLTI